MAIDEKSIQALVTALSENENDHPELLTYSEACAIAKVSRWTIHRWIQKGFIRALKLGTRRSCRVRIDAASLRAFLDSLEIPHEEAL